MSLTIINPYVFATGGGGGGGGPDDTQYYVEVTIPTTSVASTLTNFPVYVSLATMPAAFWTHVQADGGDIRVTQSDGSTRCPVDLVKIDTGAETGELHFLAPTVSSASDTTYRIYYGHGALTQPAVGDAYGRNAVWADYLVVLHMNEDPSGSAPQMVDSTGNGHDGTSDGSMTAGDLIDGKLAGGALGFDGSNDRITFSTLRDAVAGAAAATFTAWVYKNSGSNDGAIWGANYASGTQFLVWFDNAATDNVSGFAADGGNRTIIQGTEAAPAAAWFHAAMIYQGSGVNTTSTHVNGGGGASGANTLNAIGAGGTGNPALATDHASTTSRALAGRIDEARIRLDAVSTDWLAAEYSNQNAPASFYSVGSEQSA